jgi:hypothetical protein
VIGAKAQLVDLKRPFKGRLRTRQIAQIQQYPAQIVKISGDVGVLGAKALLVDLKRSFCDWQSLPGTTEIDICLALLME